MGTLSFAVKNTGIGWTGNCTVNYTVQYDAEANTTTVTFLESSFNYYGRNNYGSSAEASISVKAADNEGSTASASVSASGVTTGGSKTFAATPSPVSVTVQHGSADGSKSVVISASATIKAYMTGSATAQTTGTGSGSVTEQSGTREEKNVAIRVNGQIVKGTLYVGKKKGTIYIGSTKV